MKEILGLLRTLPDAARHHSLRWHLGYTARVAVWTGKRYARAALRLVVWHVYNAVGLAAYKFAEVLRWLTGNSN